MSDHWERSPNCSRSKSKSSLCDHDPSLASIAGWGVGSTGRFFQSSPPKVDASPSTIDHISRPRGIWSNMSTTSCDNPALSSSNITFYSYSLQTQKNTLIRMQGAAGYGRHRMLSASLLLLHHAPCHTPKHRTHRIPASRRTMNTPGSLTHNSTPYCPTTSTNFPTHCLASRHQTLRLGSSSVQISRHPLSRHRTSTQSIHPSSQPQPSQPNKYTPQTV